MTDLPQNAYFTQGQGAASAGVLNAMVQAVPTVAALRNIVGVNLVVVYLEGFTTPGDSGQGHFWWNSAATGADNGTTVVKSPGVSGPGAWIRLFDYSPAPPLWGGLSVIAPNDGVTDATSALIAASLAGMAIFIPAGTYLITGNVTFTTPVTMGFGAVLLATTTVAVAFIGGFYAPVTQVFNFTGGATVAFSPSETLTGYAEWWGAQTGNPALDCAPPIAAAFLALTTTQLLAGAYYVATPAVMTTNGHFLRGAGSTQLCATNGPGSPGTGNIDPNATQIVIVDAAATGLVFGFTDITGGTMLNSGASDFTVVRATATTPLGVVGALAIANPVAGVLPCPTNIQCGALILCRFRNIISIEASNAWYVHNVVESYWDDCTGLRYTAGANPSNDNFSAFYLDYSAPLVGNGGNASIYLNRCRMFSSIGISGGLTMTYAAGITSADGFVDLFISQPEGGLLQYGVDLSGDGFSSTTYANENCQIINPILDSNTVRGIRIRNGGELGVVKIIGGYVDVSGPGTCVEITSFGGAASVAGVQFISNFAGSTGVAVTAGAVVTLQNNIYTDINAPVTLTGTLYSSVADTVHGVNVTGTRPAIAMTGCIGCRVAMSVTGVNGAYNAGAALDATSQKNEINLTQIQNSTVGGVANKIVYNGAPWGGGSTFGTGNLATGVLT